MQHGQFLLLSILLSFVLSRTTTAVNQIDYGHPLYELQYVQQPHKEIYQFQRDVVEDNVNVQPPPPPDVSSLTFVFDQTGSMNDDLNQVRHGAKRIFETVMKQRKKLIYNFVLVLFHDPEISLPFITTDPDLFQQQLASVSVQGGGDCPEMALSGIKKALEVSLPGSYIYVFTDARSKDFHLESAVLNLIQEKQSSVVFVMTGDCGNRSAPGYKVFERIAAASFGQVFHLEKSHVNTVLEYVRHSVARRKVHILYEVREYGQTHTSLVPIDTSFSELVISLAGVRDDSDLMDIELIDPHNRRIDKYEHDDGTINLKNIKLVRLLAPVPGIWRVRTSSRLKHTLLIFGHGDIDFKYGFSSQPVSSLDLTHPRPIAGQPTYLLIKMSGLRPPGALEHVSLVDYYGDELYRNETRLYPGDISSIHFVGPLIPPKVFFFVRVKGKDSQNYEFLRIAPTAIAAVDVIGPRAYMAERLTATAYSPVNLTCSIESRVPFTVHWLFGSRTIGGPLFYENTDTSTWTIDAITPAHRGYYTCLVVSSLGNHSVSTFLESKELPPDIIAMRNESILLHETAFLHCITQSIEQPRINWMHNHSLNVGNSAKTYTYDNGTLRIHDASFEDVGTYTCFARTSGGQSEETSWLTVMQPPRVRVEPREIFSVEGTTFTLQCITTGVPKPDVTWYFRGSLIFSDPKFYISQKDELIVTEVDDEDEGSYTCQAKNKAGTASASTLVHIAVPPTIIVSQNKQIITKDDSIMLDCQVISGIPSPTIVWWKDGRQLFTNRYIQIQENGRLTILHADVSDAGTYACKAENIAGSAIKPLTIGVGSSPTILPSPETIFVQIGHTATLICRADGNPKPQIQWLKNSSPIDGLIEEQLRYSQLPDNSLHIRASTLSDQSTFTCIARNQFGEQRKHTNLVITGLVSPVLASLPSKIELVEGKDLQINCIVLLGNPRPEIEWLKGGRALTESISKENAILLRDGSLLLKNGSDVHKGTYTCRAKSAAGIALQDVNVGLIMKPRMLQTDIEDILVAKHGTQLEIPCPLHVPEGQIRPKVIWAHDSQPLNVNTPEYVVLPNLSLRILRVSSSHIGRYTCTAVNEAGKLEKTTLVLAPPEVGTDVMLEVMQGEVLPMNCDLQNPGESTTITWLFNNSTTLPINVTVQSSGNWLHILNAQIVNHQGKYTCLVQNSVGKAKRQFNVNILEPPNFIDTTNTKYFLLQGQTVMLDCTLKGSPWPKIVWKKNNKPLELEDLSNDLGDNEPQYQLIDNDQILHISEVDIRHAGQYSCIAESRAGSAEKDISVSLLTAPIMAINQTSVELIENESQTLDCPLEDDGGSTTELYWTKDEMPIGQLGDQSEQQQNNVQRSFSGKKLYLMKAQRMDSGTYKCMAKNAAGVTESIINVLVLVPPRIEDPHGYRTLEALINDSVKMDCIASGVPIPKIEWSHNGRSLSSADSASLYFEDGKSKLHIDSVQAKNAGIFSCTATNKAGNSDMDIFLDVIGPPTIRAPATELSVVEGSEQRLECIIGGHPSPRIEWRKAGSSDNDPLAVQQQQQLEEESHTDEQSLSSEHSYFYHIHSAGQQHAGRYTCIAKNKGGEERLTIQLNVLVPPSIEKGERLIRVIEGGTASFDCPVKGLPTPKIIWRKMPQKTVLGNLDESLQHSGNGIKQNILKIKDLKAEDAGRFTCEASNEAGNATAEFVLEILRRPTLLANPANLQLRVLEGIHAKMECQASGNPDPSIMWLRAGRPIEPSNNNLIFSPRIDTLMLVKTRRSDSGEYTCRLNNSVGEAEATFTLTVLVPPHINETLDQNPRVLRNQEIRLPCPVQGFPTPSVHWLKDGKQIHFTERLFQGKLSENQNDLWIASVNTNEAGRYTCKAVNEVGQLNTDFELEVIAPPEFASEGKRNFEVIEGNSVTLVCPVEASPFPEITWLHGTDLITKNSFFSDDRKNLTLLRATVPDGGKYICNASNIAGHSEIDLQLRVLVPPQIDKSNLVSSPLAILGNEMFLECPAEGTPQPSVTWHKEERQITQSSEKYVLKSRNQTLSIKNIIPEDQGLYTCTVQNQAGQLREEFRLEVLLPPEMEEVSSSKPGDGRIPGPPLSKHEGEQLELDCPLKIKSSLIQKTTIKPMIEEELWKRMEEDDDGKQLRVAWSKDGRPLESGLNSNIEISEYPGKRLQLLTTSVSDSGEYKCIASNRAGQSYVKFLVEILSKPKIDTSRNAPEPHVIAGRPITLWCPASGNPPPTIRWFHNGVNIAQNKRYRLLDFGHGLEIQPTTKEDIGLWTCLANNAAGTSSANISLDVWVKPTLKMLVEDSIPLKPLGSFITLLCVVNGNPEPIIHWSLRGQTIIPSAGRLLISNGGQRLEIHNLRSEDAGEYRCEAQNEVGDASDSVEIDILVPPKINRETLELNPRIPLGRSFTIFCDVKAKPDAKISWSFNGISLDNDGGDLPFLSVNNGKSKFLQIENISLVHRGIFRCNASNAAGTDSIEYKVDVFDPPKIELRGGTTRILENNDVVLSCNASGEPPPVITWQRNGVLVETGARYSIEHSFLKVADTRSSDSGIYVCVATNEAGTDQQAFTLEVLVLPKLSLASQMPTQLSVPLGGNVSLGPCKGQGYPPPILQWFIADKTNNNNDFLPINSSSVTLKELEDYKIIYNESNTTTSLYLINIKEQKDKRTIFRCFGSNSAGTSNIDFTIDIVMPPLLIDNNNSVNEELRIIEGQAINISCGVKLTGQNDYIQWTHNGIEINLIKKQKNDQFEYLTIENITLNDAGNYTCLVKNSAGSANVTKRIVVGIPPKVDKFNGIRVAVSRGNTAQLRCEAFGFPPPKIHWLRDQMPLNKFMPTAVTGSEMSTSGVVVSENKRTATAILHDIKPEYAGSYFCKAENWAGTDNKTVELIVLSYPTITPERDQIRLESGQTATIYCNSSGNPNPTITWQKVTETPKNIFDDRKKYLISDDGNLLTINNVTKDDNGLYNCIARNEAGQAIGTRKIDVKLSQIERSITAKRDRIYVECDENGLPIKSTFVKARGDRPQQTNNNDEYIHWNEESDLDALSINGTDGLLTVCMPKTNDENNIVNRGTRRVSTLPSTNFSCLINNQCKYKCQNLANGSFQCICPEGYSLSEDGRCLDIDECKNNNLLQCASSQLCFNKLGSFSCIHNPCPQNFNLDRESKQCIPSCHNCTELPIRLYMLAIPKGVSVNTALLRLSALDKFGRLLKRTKFHIRSERNSFNKSDVNISYNPKKFHFAIIDEKDGRATLHSRKNLLPGSEFLLTIRSTSNNNTNENEFTSIEIRKWQSNYMVLIAVSEYLF